MKNASKLNSNLPPLSLPLSGGEVESADFFPLKWGEQKRGLFNYNPNSSNSAFTLVELAIVVVVLGILVVGVVGGQSLIESAKKQEVVTGFAQLRTGLNAFKLEFDALPGDMEDAYDYFGDECSSSEANCNGDGDRKLTGTSITGFSTYCHNNSCERCMAFKHMALAELFKTKLDCLNTGPFTDNNSYKNPLNKDSYFFLSNRCKEGIAPFDCEDPSNYTSKLYLMTASTGHLDSKDNWIRCGHAGTFTPKQQKFIDEKLDDGKPKNRRNCCFSRRSIPSEMP
jgi:prepilin-type N-terminal cleavage/methylation domain-containing protein